MELLLCPPTNWNSAFLVVGIHVQRDLRNFEPCRVKTKGRKKKVVNKPTSDNNYTGCIKGAIRVPAIYLETQQNMNSAKNRMGGGHKGKIVKFFQLCCMSEELRNKMLGNHTNNNS